MNITPAEFSAFLQSYGYAQDVALGRGTHEVWKSMDYRPVVFNCQINPVSENELNHAISVLGITRASLNQQVITQRQAITASSSGSSTVPN